MAEPAEPDRDARRAPVHAIPNELQAIRNAMLARWHDLGWAKVTGQSEITWDEEQETCRATLAIEDRHLNPGGIVHGGVVFSVIDTLMGYVVFRSARGPERMATQSQTIDFLRPAEGTVHFEARIDKRGRSTVYCSGSAKDDEGRLVARSTSVWAVRPHSPDTSV